MGPNAQCAREGRVERADTCCRHTVRLAEGVMAIVGPCQLLLAQLNRQTEEHAAKAALDRLFFSVRRFGEDHDLARTVFVSTVETVNRQALAWTTGQLHFAGEETAASPWDTTGTPSSRIV